ncbi:aspartic peptidase domain-containing protein [Podospora australis]|uniref:Aspartic peptidase domain-containing protein n=1 Tax=Podospora australis TaxID=1536484 RepID=A0AAN7AGD9_9PEZI|nr:aspartic peptidase domain-containing protein [Podospora australis]
MASFLRGLFLSSLAILSVQATPSRPRWIGRRSVTVDLVRNPSYAPNGPANYVRALQKWGVTVPDDLTNSFIGDSGDVNAASIKGDREYLSRVGFGTPLQYLNMDLDTGSADVWVYSSETQGVAPGSRPVYVIENSITAKKINGSVWRISYGDGSTAYGTAYHDNIDIGGITVRNAVVESALSISEELLEDKFLDGIFGLPYALSSKVSPRVPTVLSTLTKQLDQKLFTVDLKYHADDGVYTFGYIDKDRYIGDIHYTPLVPDAQYWQLNFTGIHVEPQNVWYLYQWTAIVDTGTSLMLLSDNIVKYYYTMVPEAKQDAFTGGLWVYPCNISRLPDFDLGFGDHVVTVPGKYMNYTTLTNDPTTCMGGLQSFGTDDFGILGDIFLKATYTVFDIAKGRVGFARKQLDL